MDGLGRGADLGASGAGTSASGRFGAGTAASGRF